MPTRHPPVEGSWSAGQGPVARRLAVPLRGFLDTEVAGGLVLLAATAIALGWANSPWSSAYEALWRTELAVEVGQWTLTLDLRHWVNDGLMALFFFVVGLEIKRELVVGELRRARTAALPVIAALGGMVLPALVFLAVTSVAMGREAGGSRWPPTSPSPLACWPCSAPGCPPGSRCCCSAWPSWMTSGPFW